ncbi:MAG: SusC/RagA family TonB-linked outer membrane protein [Rikenellaceae bacterium]|nr:SusC/RagA family TonB-linked outer membrane protein [Rikenellaceae bacterium]
MNAVLQNKAAVPFRRAFGLLPVLPWAVLAWTGTAQIRAQAPQTVRGTVKDEQGNPVAGVNIYDKSRTNIGTATNEQGQYTLRNAASETTLVFSMIGFQSQEIAVQSHTVIDVILREDTEYIEAVTVEVPIGYGTVNKRNSTAAMEVVNMEDIVDIPVMNLAEALVGRIPGLSVSNLNYRPGQGSATFLVRNTYSTSTLGGKDPGDGAPLIIIDDVPQVTQGTSQYNSSVDELNALNPNDLESIVVLKDAAAAIYGAKGAQGAILIKTKRGRAGEARISYSGNIGWNDIAGRKPRMMSGEQLAVFWNKLQSAHRETNERYYYSDEEIARIRDLNYDWLDEAWHKGFTTRHSLSLSGGTERTTYHASGSYLTQGENMGHYTQYNNWGFRSGLNTRIGKGLKVDFQLFGTSRQSKKPYSRPVGEGADYQTMLRMPQWIPWQVQDEQGQWQYVAPYLNIRSVPANNANDLSAANYFALDDAGNYSGGNDFSYTLQGSVLWEVPWVQGLSVKGSLTQTESFSKNLEYGRTYSYLRPTNNNELGHHLYEDMEFTMAEYSRSSRALYDRSNAKRLQMNAFVSYNRDFGDHHVDAMVSVERGEEEYEFNRMYYQYPFHDYFDETTGTSGTWDSNTISRNASGSLSYLGRANYSYLNRYFLTFVFRSDASTKFAPENYWGFFPSVAAAWIISDEDFFRSVRGVDFLKLRLSWGKSGADNTKMWQWLQTFELETFKGAMFGTAEDVRYTDGLKMSISPNRDMKWSDSYKYNLGVDARFLRGRLSASVDLWYVQDKNILSTRSDDWPYSLGTGIASNNYGDVDSWGYEISVGWSDRVGRDFKYSVDMSTAFSDNKVKKWIDPSVIYPWTTGVKGRSTATGTWGYKVWKGNERGDGILHTDADFERYWNYLQSHANEYNARYGVDTAAPNYMGITDLEELKKTEGILAYQDLSGKRQEDGTFHAPDGEVNGTNADVMQLKKKNAQRSINTQLRAEWKGISLSTQIATSWDSFIERERNTVKYNGTLQNNYAYWADMYSREYNPEGSIPSMYYTADKNYNNATSDFWQLNSFSMMIRNLTVGYTVTREFSRKVGTGSIRVTFSGNNLWYIVDPYRSYRSSWNSLTATYPVLRTWTFGLNLTL